MTLQPLASQRHRVRIGQPLPFGIRDGDGRLLLARGQVIGSQDQFDGLLDRGTFIDGAEAAGDEPPAVRIAKARPDELPAIWEEGMGRMQRALRARIDGEFRSTLERASAPVLALIQRDPDMAILQVVRPDEGGTGEYASRHAVHTAVAGQLAAVRLGWGGDTASNLFRAALTMNLSMTELQTRLATQVTPPTALQRQAINEHPQRSAELLQTAGVTDPDWLGAVARHHELPDGSGYPQGLRDVCQLGRMLNLADKYTAKFAARAVRAAMAPDAAARHFFRCHQADPLAAAVVKEFGLYPPGCTVRLKSNELAVVVRRGETTTTPTVAVVVSRCGEPLLTPGRRDTSNPAFAIAAVVPAAAVKVRIQLEALIRACH